MKVAVPPLKHSCKFGQAASSQTVAILWRRKICLISCTFGEADRRTRIHGGLRCISVVGMTFTGILSTLSALRNFSPAFSRRVRLGGAVSSSIVGIRFADLPSTLSRSISFVGTVLSTTNNSP